MIEALQESLKKVLGVKEESKQKLELDEFNRILKDRGCIDTLETDLKSQILPTQNIPSLKKRIKHCKNPMEKKMIEKELNVLYKKQKNIKNN